MGGAPDGGSPPPPDAGVSEEETSQPDPGPPETGPVEPLPAPEGGTLAAPAWPELQTEIATFALTVTPEHLQELEAHVEDRDYGVPAQFTYQGRTWDVELRYRGRSTRDEPKKPYSVRFPKEGRFLGGVKRLELLAAYKDAGYLTEKLWYDLAASVGLKVPRTHYVHLSINGQYQGLYTEIGDLEKAFLRAHSLDDDSDIYRCGMQDCELRPMPREPYMEPWDKRTNEDAPWDGLWSFIDGINRTPPHAFRAFAEREVALDGYLTWMVLDTFIANDYQVDSRSFLVYEREQREVDLRPVGLEQRPVALQPQAWRAAGRLGWASRPLFGFTAYDPYVYDLAEWRRSWGELDMKPAWSTLTTRILDDEVLRARYAARLRTLLDTWLTEENLARRINATHQLLRPFILPDAQGQTLDPYVSPAHAAAQRRVPPQLRARAPQVAAQPHRRHRVPGPRAARHRPRGPGWLGRVVGAALQPREHARVPRGPVPLRLHPRPHAVAPARHHRGAAGLRDAAAGRCGCCGAARGGAERAAARAVPLRGGWAHAGGSVLAGAARSGRGLRTAASRCRDVRSSVRTLS